MSTDKDNKKLCPEHGIPLTRICIEESCKIDSRLICSECLLSYHMDEKTCVLHRTINIKSFLEKVLPNKNIYREIIENYKEISKAQELMDSKLEVLYNNEYNFLAEDIKNNKEKIILQNEDSGLGELMKELNSHSTKIKVIKQLFSANLASDIFDFTLVDWNGALELLKDLESQDFLENFNEKIKKFGTVYEEIENAKAGAIKSFFGKLRMNLEFKITPFSADLLNFKIGFADLTYINLKKATFPDIYNQINKNFACQMLYSKIRHVLENENGDTFCWILLDFYKSFENYYPGGLMRLLYFICKVLISESHKYKVFLAFSRFYSHIFKVYILQIKEH